MGSRTHSLGQGESLGLIGRGDLASIFAAQGARFADIRPALYIQPAGNGLHYVQNVCNSQPYQVASAAGNQTFVKGAVVQLGSHVGQPGEFIIGGAALGQAGASDAPISASVSFAAFPSPPYAPPSLSVCPTPITGRSYLALDIPGGGVLNAWIYSDGIFGSALGTVNYSVIDSNLGGIAQESVHRIHSLGDVIVFQQWRIAGANIVDQIVTWTPGGSYNILDTTHVAGPTFAVPPGGHIIGPAWRFGTSELWFLIYSTSGGTAFVQAYRVAVNASGTLVLSSAAVGTPFSSPISSFPGVADWLTVCTHFLVCASLRLDLGSLTWSVAPPDLAGSLNAAPVNIGGQSFADGSVPENGTGSRINPWPGSWNLVGPASPAPDQGSMAFFNPDGNFFARLAIPVGGYSEAGGACPLHVTTIGPGPGGDQPVAWMCRS
jgi:hypothetical protein